MNNKDNTPILLIGLGGIGSEIVNNIFGRMKRENIADKVQALVFDTDINSQKKLTNIGDECKIQTSTDKTVKYTVENNPNVKEWFPENSLVDKMQMINGAGQIRSVSRLALYSAIKDGKLGIIKTVSDRLNLKGMGKEEKGLRVMVVSSLMGGTGSGIFLQIPLYIRKIFENEIDFDRIDIHGTFILPDVLKSRITRSEIKNVYANAYASMKELYAIINSTNDKRHESININLEYMPDQINDKLTGYRDIAVKTNPYDYCYFYDKEDTKGNVLLSFEDYKRMIEENIYYQLCGSISDKMYSHYINEIKNTIEHNGLNIFGGVGLGKLIYPYDDIVDYCVNKALGLGLENQMLKIDSIYEEAYKKYRMDLDNGKVTPKPNIADIYCSNFDILSSTDNFFFKVKREITKVDENGNVVSDKIRNIQKFTNDRINLIINEPAFSNEKTNCLSGIESCVNSPVVSLKRDVSTKESQFISFRSVIENNAYKRAKSVAFADLGVYSDNDFSDLMKELFDGENLINPVGIRYILYKLSNMYRNAKIRNDNDITKFKTELDDFEKRSFALKSGEKNDANYACSEVCSHKGLFNSNLNEFRNKYKVKCEKHIECLNSYLRASIASSYYEVLIDIFERLLKEYESMFSSLKDKQKEVNNNIEYLRTKHDDTTGMVNLYVLADSKSKDMIWNSIPSNIQNEILASNLSTEMFKVLNKNMKYKLNTNVVGLTTYSELFDNLIFNRCKERFVNNTIIKENIDLNIIEALYKERDYKGYDRTPEDYIKERLRNLINYVSPWTPKPENGADDFSIWGISNACRNWGKGQTNKSELERLIEVSVTSSETPNIASDDKLSDREIVYMITRYGLLVSDFTKFSAGKNNSPDGEYYNAYNQVIHDVNQNISITPHLDKRWNNTLPDINVGIVQKGKEDVAKAFIIGITKEYFKPLTASPETSSINFMSIFDNIPAFINCQGSNIDGKIKHLYEALDVNPDLVESCNETINSIIENERELNSGGDIFQSPFINKLLNIRLFGYDVGNNIIDIFVNLYKETSHVEMTESFDEKYNLLYKVLKDIIEQIVLQHCFGKGEEAKKHYSQRVFQQLLDNSYWAKEIKKDDIVYASTIGKIKYYIDEYN